MASLKSSGTVSSPVNKLGRTPGFFDLPRELRNRIYALISLHTHALSTKHKNRTYHTGDTIDNLPDLNMLLVSKQIKQEYLEEIQIPSATLTIRNTNTNATYFDFKNFIPKVSRIIMCMKVHCEATPTGGRMNRHPQPWSIVSDGPGSANPNTTCGAVSEIKDWTQTMKENIIPQLPEHDAFHVKLGLYWCSDEECSWPRHIHALGLRDALDELVATLPTMTSLEIALFDCNPDYEAWKKGKLEMETWAKWSKESGWQAGTAKGRRKVCEGGSVRDLKHIRHVERMKVIGPTMRLMDQYW